MTDKHTTITELKARFHLSELNVGHWNRIHFQLAPESMLEDERLTEYRFYRIEEMTDEKAAVHRLAMSNVIANMSDSRATLLYMLLSDGQGIHFYIGVASNDNGVVHDIGIKLERAFSSNLLGAKLAAVKPQDIAPITSLLSMKRLGVVTGVPSLNEEETRLGDEEFQGVERLVNGLAGESWRMVIACQPGSAEEVEQIIEQIYDLSTQLSSQMKYSVQISQNQSEQHTHSTGQNLTKTSGTSITLTNGEGDSRAKSVGVNETRGSSKGTSSSYDNKGTNHSQGTSSGTTTTSSTNKSHARGTSDSESVGSNEGTSDATTSGDGQAVTREEINKGYEELLKHLGETQISRFRQGNSKGMFKTSLFLAAKTNAVYERLSASVRSIFQGNNPTLTPLRVHRLQHGVAQLGQLLQLADAATGAQHPYSEAIYSLVSASHGRAQCSTWLNSQEISLLMGLPDKELAGLKIRKCVDFALNPPDLPESQQLTLGQVIQHGQPLAFKPLTLDKSELNKHIFITGVTGSGKTTSCMKLLLESGLPFLVIEPAKTEYRELYQKNPDVEYYCLGREDITPFRLNPFELVSSKETLTGHIDILKNALNAVFPMEAAMPMIVAEAIIQAYERKGWDIFSNQNLLIEEPFALNSGAWPNFSDMIRELDSVIESKGMGKEFEEKYRGSLVARLTDLTKGTKSRMLNARHSIDFDALLDKRVVFELDEIKDENDKSLLMALIVTRLAETIKQRYLREPGYRHLTLIEEAHRLLAKPEPGEGGSKKLGVEMFCNLLAEVRKYGEGLIIADQIPNKLIPDVIKNTNTKIVHRLFSADDREVIGDTMSLSDEQKNFLPSLQTGQAVIYGGGWHGAVLTQIKPNANTTGQPIDERTIADRGIQQWWPQRARLFPQLAAQTHFDDPQAFIVYSQQIGNLLRLITLARQLQPSASLNAQLLRIVGQLKTLNACEPDLIPAMVAWTLDNTDLLPDAVHEKMPRRLAELLKFIDIAPESLDFTVLAARVNDMTKK
ncbi:ATP-binding protein [Atlantibacter hermannii]|uniref:ATP-binding protein n=1 Tax=Atlantibacter hermannii TaxID=565 RepID=UPI00289C3814|nr:hypothetical protein [Atlantibacter hermannii]